MKKLLSVLLFAGLMFGMALPAFATRPENSSNRYEEWLQRRAELRERIRIYIAEANPRGTRPEPSNPMPEPSSALIFGAGLLVAGGVARKRRN